MEKAGVNLGRLSVTAHLHILELTPGRGCQLSRHRCCAVEASLVGTRRWDGPQWTRSVHVHMKIPKTDSCDGGCGLIQIEVYSWLGITDGHIWHQMCPSRAAPRDEAQLLRSLSRSLLAISTSMSSKICRVPVRRHSSRVPQAME